MASETPDLRLPSQPHGRRCLVTYTKLYCLVTEARVCERLAQSGFL